MKSLLTSLLPGVLLTTACNREQNAADSSPTDVVMEGQVATSGVASRVVVLMLDGARVEETFGFEETTDGYSEALDGPSDGGLPSIRENLVPYGGLNIPAYSTGVTTTMPSHATLLQGKRRNYGSPSAQDGLGAGLYRPDLPTIFELARKQLTLPEEGVSVVGNTVNLISLDYGFHPGYGPDYGTTFEVLTQTGSSAPSNEDSLVVDAVQSALEGGARVVIANLHNIDRAAHNEPETSYAEALADVDGPIVKLWSWIQSEDSGIKDETVLVITSDHGRHRFDELDPVWTGHGDDCSGCREIPLFLIGPGVAPGAESTAPATVEDVHRTVTWLMGLDSPYADGLVLSELLNIGEDKPISRSGDAAPARHGDLSALQRWRSDFSRRSEIVLDGEVLDDQDVFTAEQPVVLSGADTDYACWRQLALPPGQDYYPWTLRCVERASGAMAWTDIGFPLDRLPPDVEPALALDAEGSLVVAVADLLVTDVLNIGNNSQISLFSWDGSRWSQATRSSEDALAIEPILQSAGEEGLFLALARGDDISRNRYSRHIEVHQLTPQSDNLTWTSVFSSLDEGISETYTRIEHPALWISGEDGLVVGVGYSADGVALLASFRIGEDWSAMRVIDDVQPLPHVRPVFSADGALFWGRYGEEAAELCRWLDGETTCSTLSSAHIERIAPVSNTEAIVSVLGARMSWSLETVTF